MDKTLITAESLERELTDLAPLVREGLAHLAPPAAVREEAIMREALRALRQRGYARRWQWQRLVALAAVFLLLLAGSMHLWLSETPAVHSAPLPREVDESTLLFATILLDAQGLSEAQFFRTEEAEALWL